VERRRSRYRNVAISERLDRLSTITRLKAG
jgi:hypothetical protein